MAVRIVSHGVAAVLAFLVGLSLGYYLWGLRVTDLTSQLRQQRSECDFRVAEQERRAKAAEERARQEAETRKVFEEELQRVRPLK
jgi:C4-dicarboxylate-specific signal transduction histidine kinase